MVNTGKVIGIQPYLYTPEGKNVTYSGYRIFVSRDLPKDSGVDGVYAETLSISDRDLCGYTPKVNDPVRYNTYRDKYGKTKCGFIVPI